MPNLRRLIGWILRKRCVDCGLHSTHLFEYATGQYVCLQCAYDYGYYETMQSVAEALARRDV